MYPYSVQLLTLDSASGTLTVTAGLLKATWIRGPGQNPLLHAQLIDDQSTQSTPSIVLFCTEYYYVLLVTLRVMLPSTAPSAQDSMLHSRSFVIHSDSSVRPSPLTILCTLYRLDQHRYARGPWLNFQQSQQANSRWI